MDIKVLGTGCKKCKKLEENVTEAISLSGIAANVYKEENIQEIMKYGVMSTPGLVIDEKVVSTGKVLSTDDIVDLLNK